MNATVFFGIVSRRKNINVGTILLIVFGIFCSFAYAQGVKMINEFGVGVAYEINTPVCFPPFCLTFLGKREIKYADSFFSHTGYVFRLSNNPKDTNNAKDAEVIWVSGGELCPERFKFEGESYILELQESFALGDQGDPKSYKLKDNQMIVWQELVFDQAASKNRT